VARTLEGRQAVDLDGEWRFVPDPERLLSPDRLKAGSAIRVPGCWEAQVGRRPIVTAWYRRELSVPSDWRGDRAMLCFGAVMYAATVFLNGRRIGEHEGGYTPFEFDVTEAVRFDAENELAVRVVNPMNALRAYPASQADLAEADLVTPQMPVSEIPHGKQTWYSSQSGIWQSVRLERRSRPWLEAPRVTPLLGRSMAVVGWSLDGRSVAMAGHPPPPGTLDIELSIADPDGAIIARRRVSATGSAAGEATLPVPEPRAWDIRAPNLYRAEVVLLADGEPIDRVTVRFGMRDIRADGGRILLNGRPIYLLGVLDQDLYADTISTPPSRGMLDLQLARVRELGVNLLRCHIKVPDHAYLDAADEAGMLVWCELPNWRSFTPDAAQRGRATLEAMVRTLGNHPSLIAWTIINEDWGTRVKEEVRDRLWLAQTYDWLKSIDPGRLVVDNSACDTASSPNFHVRTDVADFHLYHAAPDNLAQWRSRIEEFAARPSWLWSPHGDATVRGDEPLVLSEFGAWGVPRLDRLAGPDETTPWWFETGRDHLRPDGTAERFVAYGLHAVWGSVDELAEATQWHQFEALQYEIGELRRHDAVQGYVITELSDAYWEANGLLDVHRGRKAFHDRFAAINADDVIVADLQQRDVWAGERFECAVHLGSYGGDAESGYLTWDLVGDEGPLVQGRVDIDSWPSYGARAVGRLDVDVPPGASGDARLEIAVFDESGRRRATNDYRLAILPAGARVTTRPLRVRVEDVLGIWGIEGRLRRLGHELADDGAITVGSALSPAMLAAVADGRRGLVLVRDRAAIPEGVLERPVRAQPRAAADPSSSDGRTPWDGNWVTAWSWLKPGVLAGLPERNPLDFAYAQVTPDHVLTGYDPALHRDEVIAGMFAGWIHAPAALIWTMPHGRGQLTLTTFRVAPEDGPVATALLDALVAFAANVEARAATDVGISIGAPASR
jgi:hypothetical protein